MKKIAKVSVCLLFVACMLCSCTTTFNVFKPNPGEYTEEEAGYALKVTLQEAVSDTNTRFFQKLNTYDFVPAVYKALVENESTIPGMERILSQWNENVSSYLEDCRSIIETCTSASASEIVFENTMELVAKSDTSASELFERKYGDDFVELIRLLIEDLDCSTLESAVKQYNAWVAAEKFIHGTNRTQMEIIDVKNDIARIIFNYYRDTVFMYEELLRTTPSPYTDEICKNVFGIE